MYNFFYQLYNRHSRVENVQKMFTWWQLLYRFPLLLAFDVIMQAEIVQKMVTRWQFLYRFPLLLAFDFIMQAENVQKTITSWQFLYIQHIRPTVLQTVGFRYSQNKFL